MGSVGEIMAEIHDCYEIARETGLFTRSRFLFSSDSSMDGYSLDPADDLSDVRVQAQNRYVKMVDR